MRRSESIGTYDEVELNRPKNYIYREISIIICARWARDSDPHTDAPGARNCAARNGNRLLLRPGRHGSRGGRHLVLGTTHLGTEEAEFDVYLEERD